MHDHNKDGGGKGMMWMMIPCILLIAFVLLSGGGLASSKYIWLIIIGVCVVPHVWMMFKGHGHGGTDTEDKIDDASAKQPGEKDEHKHNGSCH